MQKKNSFKFICTWFPFFFVNKNKLLFFCSRIIEKTILMNNTNNYKYFIYIYTETLNSEQIIPFYLNVCVGSLANRNCPKRERKKTTQTNNFRGQLFQWITWCWLFFSIFYTSPDTVGVLFTLYFTCFFLLSFFECFCFLYDLLQMFGFGVVDANLFV